MSYLGWKAMKLNVGLAVFISILICGYDFFNRLYYVDIDIADKEIKPFSYAEKERKDKDITTFLNENFTTLVEKENAEKAIQQAKEKQNNLSAQNQEQDKQAEKVPPSFVKVIGTLFKNNSAMVVIEITKANQANKIYTLKAGESFPEGKVVKISSLEAVIDIQGQHYALPVFKDKNIQVEG